MRVRIWTWFMLVVVSCAAHATPTFINAGLNGYSGMADCAYRVSGGCAWFGGPLNAYNTYSAPVRTATSATSYLLDPLRGVASSAAYASPSTYLPELHAYASSNGTYAPDLGTLNPAMYTGGGSAFADANTWGVQGYRYDGATVFDLAVTITLDSIFSVDGQNGGIGHSAFMAAIFGIDGYDFERDGACATYVTQASCPTVNVLARTFGGLTNTGTTTAILHYLLNPGDMFYVGAFLDANVCCGGTVDSSHTLRMTFNDASMLSSVAVAGVLPLAADVDEPGGAELLLTGLVLVALIVKRRRDNAHGVGPDCIRPPSMHG